jgi:AAA+ ATPase superfamily predicted ATPase
MTIARSNTNTPEARLIYESPDGGKTVYAREVGSDKKFIVKQDPEIAERQKIAVRANRLMTILKLSRTDTTLKDALEALEALYIIKYSDDKND